MIESQDGFGWYKGRELPMGAGILLRLIDEDDALIALRHAGLQHVRFASTLSCRNMLEKWAEAREASPDDVGADEADAELVFMVARARAVRVRVAGLHVPLVDDGKPAPQIAGQNVNPPAFVDPAEQPNPLAAKAPIPARALVRQNGMKPWE